MLSLPPALFLVMLGLTVGSFVSLYLLDLRGDTTRNFVLFQGVLYFIFGILTLLAMNAFGSLDTVRGRGVDEPWLAAQGALTLAFVLLMLPWNVLVVLDRTPRATGKKAEAQPGDTPDRYATVRRLRYVFGGLVALVGLATLFTVGMGYRTLADSRLDGAFVVASFLAGGLALGSVMTAMLLGHWYLNTPTASGRPLEFVTTFMLATLALELLFALLIGPSTANPTLAATNTGPGTVTTVTTPTVQPTATAQPTAQASQTPAAEIDNPNQAKVTPIDTTGMVFLQIITGYLAPLVLGGVALWLTRGRSFQSATGMLYLCVAFVFLGEILARGLLLLPIF